MNPVVWLGTPDVQMMPGLVKGVNVKGGRISTNSSTLWLSRLSLETKMGLTGCPTFALRRTWNTILRC